MTAEVTRTLVAMGASTTYSWKLADGSYLIHLAGAARAIEETSVDLTRCLRSNEFQFLTGNRYTNHPWNELPIPSDMGGDVEVTALPLEAVAAYWLCRSYQGNNKALALCLALISGKLEQRLDQAFGVSRNESEPNQAMSDRASSIEQALYANNLNLDGELLSRVRSYEYWFKMSGLNPNEPPPYFSYKEWEERGKHLLDELEPLPQPDEEGRLTSLIRILPAWLRRRSPSDRTNRQNWQHPFPLTLAGYSDHPQHKCVSPV